MLEDYSYRFIPLLRQIFRIISRVISLRPLSKRIIYSLGLSPLMILQYYKCARHCYYHFDSCAFVRFLSNETISGTRRWRLSGEDGAGRNWDAGIELGPGDRVKQKGCSSRRRGEGAPGARHRSESGGRGWATILVAVGRAGGGG